MTADANWREAAACRDADPELFFPIGTTGPALRQIREATRICRTCPAQTRCLAWALDHGVTDGVWGGTTEDQRRAIRSLSTTMTSSQEDDDGGSYHPAERREHAIRTPPAQAKATWIRRDAGIGRDAGGTGTRVTRDTERHQR
jgi:WhiB family transcriptional regulator, redox-sensing transcriptional regulator